jgi:hypothetical protein
MAVHGHPEPEDVGTEGSWVIPLSSTGTADFAGRLLGFASTRQEVHSHTGRFTDGRPCTACRWFETAVFATAGSRYSVLTSGMSNMPGETDRTKLREARDAMEAVFMLSSPGAGRGRFLSKPVQEMLEQAGEQDNGIGTALEQFLDDPGVDTERS